ncbi:MAG: hypothetical protein JWM64_1860 [Frankiales bacterium]|nr:hypothetical protein [Frankiales bacterium]
MPSPRTETRPPTPTAGRSSLLPVVLVALPGLVVAALGTLHPLFLTPDTAERWRLAHLLLLPAFPLVAVALWAVLRGVRTLAADAARLLAAAYALLYGALDSIAGIGAPHQVLGAARRGEPGPPIGDLYDIGDRLGHAGVWALAGAGVVAAAVLYARSRNPLALLGGAVLAASCYPFSVHHVFPPRGVLAMVGIAVGTGLLEAGRARRT